MLDFGGVNQHATFPQKPWTGVSPRLPNKRPRPGEVQGGGLGVYVLIGWPKTKNIMSHNFDPCMVYLATFTIKINQM